MNDIEGRSLYYDKQGQPISYKEFSRLKWDLSNGKVSDYARIGYDELDDSISVSTVWLGLDHRFTSDDGAAPVIFETMVFGGEHDGELTRYTTEKQARKGHERAVARMKAGHHPVL